MVLDRYIAKMVLKGFFIATLIMLGIFIFVDFVAQLKSVGTGDYGDLQAFMYVFLQLPKRFYELSPSILLLGSIFSLGAMAANSELIVMRASGISSNKITGSVLKTGLLIALMVVLIGEYVVPVTTGMAKTMRAEAMEKKLIVGGYNDIWLRDENRYVNVKQVLPNYQLKKISIYEIDKKRRLKKMLFAEKARYEKDKWLVNDIKQTDIRYSDTTADDMSAVLPQTTVTYTEQRVMKRLVLLELFSVLELRARDMSIQNLYTYSQYLKKNNLDAGEYELAFWIKVFMPATCLAMLLIAMLMVLTISPRSGGLAQRTVLAVIIAIVFYVVSRALNLLGLSIGMEPIVSTAAPIVFIVVVVTTILQRIR